MVGRTPRIFVSSTTSDLGTFRVVVDSALIDKETLPISQAHFEADGRPVVEFLENKIASSDAVICLIGPSYSSEPNRREPHAELSSKERAAWTEVLTQVVRGLVTIKSENRIRLEEIESQLAAIDTHVKAAMWQRRVRISKQRLLTTSIVAIISLISSWGWYTHYQNKIETRRRQLAMQQEQETLIGCEASKLKYHFEAAVESHNRELVNELDPLDYSAFTLLKTSSYFDLSHWKQLPAGSTTQNGGQVERSDNVRVIHLIRKRSVSGDNSKIRVHYFTSGYDVFLRCRNRPFVLRARKDRDSWVARRNQLQLVKSKSM